MGPIGQSGESNTQGNNMAAPVVCVCDTIDQLLCMHVRMYTMKVTELKHFWSVDDLDIYTYVHTYIYIFVTRSCGYSQLENSFLPTVLFSVLNFHGMFYTAYSMYSLCMYMLITGSAYCVYAY